MTLPERPRSTDAPSPADPLPPWRRRRVLGLVGVVVAAGLTVVWLFVVPEQADQTHGLQAAAIRWGHPATWALLALFGVLVALDAPKPIRDTVAWASLACYAAFWAGLLL